MASTYFQRFLVFIISICAIASTAYAESGRTDYDLDDDGLIEINSLADLNEIRNNLDGTTLYGESTGCPVEGCNGFELTTTLDFDTNADGVMDENDTYWNEGYGWEPIGDYNSPFTANFDGNGHQILNLYIQKPSTNFVGLFGYARGETVVLRGFGIAGELMNVNANLSAYVGAFTGVLSEGAVLSDVYSTGSVSGSSSTGGLVGRGYSDSSIVNSFSTSAVNGGSGSRGSGSAGGLIGSLSDAFTINNSFFSGIVKGIYSGGLIGGAYNSYTNHRSSTIKNSFSFGRIAGREGYTGGIIGLADPDDVVILNGYWSPDITGQDSGTNEPVSGSYLGATLAELQCPTSSDDTECLISHTLYASWDATVWDFGTNQELPGLIINGVVYRDSDGDGALDINQAPEVTLVLKQDGDVVPDVIVGAGDVTIEAVITDPDVSDVHTLTWTLSDSSLMGETDNMSASFSSDNIPDGEYTVAVVATDNRYSPLSDDASITFTVERNASSAPENSTSSGSSGGGGALGVFWVLMLSGLMRLRSRRSNIPS